MLFGKKKKFHASTRFQRKDFSRRVTAASGYKRSVRKRPEGELQIFLAKIGLGSKLRQAGVAAVLVALVYLVYIPNFLFVRDISIEGANPDSSSVQNTALDFFNSYKGLWPRRNIIFLNNEDLTEYLLSHNTEVLKVNFVKKQLWNKVTVSIIPRVERFSLSTEAGNFIIYNDGVVGKKLGQDERFPPGLAHLKIPTNDEIRVGETYISGDIAHKIDETFREFQSVTGKVLDFVEIPVVTHEKKVLESVVETPPSEIVTPSPVEAVNEKEELNLNQFILFVKKDAKAKDDRTNFRVLIDPAGASPSELAVTAKQMFAQMAPEKFNALYYIDLRFKDKVYVCLKNAVCAQTFSPVIIAPTPKPETNAPAAETNTKN